MFHQARKALKVRPQDAHGEDTTKHKSKQKFGLLVGLVADYFYISLIFIYYYIKRNIK